MARVRSIITTIVLLLAIQHVSAKDIVIIDESKQPSEKKALFILPGFGSLTHGVKNIRDFYRDKGYDLFIPDYISRKSIAACTENIAEFIEKYQLVEYGEVHMLSYIVGAWSFNNWWLEHPFPNLTRIVYDRSPLQERAPYALVEDIPFLSRFVAGKTLKELSETAYPTVPRDPNVDVGIVIENIPTKMMIKRRETARELGPIIWDVRALNQPYTDYCYIPYNHDDLYEEFDDAGDEILHFLKFGSFTEHADKRMPRKDPLREE